MTPQETEAYRLEIGTLISQALDEDLGPRRIRRRCEIAFNMCFFLPLVFASVDDLVCAVESTAFAFCR
jgi:hypothetical protein